jgi:DNA-binding transcriptional regulator YiaG
MNLIKKAQQLGIGKSTLHRWLRGKSTPSPLARERLIEKDPELYIKLEKLWKNP